MRFGPLWSLLLDEKSWVLGRVLWQQRGFYRMCFLAGALRSGMLARLADGPVPFDALAAEYAPDPAMRDAFESWLRVGCLLGELSLGPNGYRLTGYLARKLTLPEHDAAAAFLVELSTLHARLLLETPERLAEGRPFTLTDQDGELVARSSRVVEPALVEAIRRCVPREGAVRLLEVGCGSGIYLRHAAEWNAELTGRGLELQPEVAEMARENLDRWGLAERFEVASGDIRAQRPDPDDLFDFVTLHNNIYYFPVSERTALLGHLRGFLRPGGTLLLTTGTAGGAVGIEVLSLWGAATEGCGRLPGVDELVGQLRDAGFVPEPALRLLPGQAFHVFVGRVPLD